MIGEQVASERSSLLLVT